MRSKRGITLVSLVVTIIVLIILAGVSINLTLGENGIITMAKRARENMELAKVDEERQLNELYEQIVTEGASSGNASDDAIIRLAQFKREIASAITDMGIETAENADASTMSSNIRSILGTASADKVSYDNTNSNLEATNVQGAVDELNESLENLGEVASPIFITSSNVYEFSYDLSEYTYFYVVMHHKDGFLLQPTTIPISRLDNNLPYAISYYDGSVNPFMAFKYANNQIICTNYNSANVLNGVYVTVIK